MGKIISGFPGIGKTFLADSRPGVRNPEFPGNYLDRLAEVLPQYAAVVVSSHDVVRQAMTFRFAKSAAGNLVNDVFERIE